MIDKEEITKLIYEKLAEGNMEDVFTLISEKLDKEKTRKLKLTKTTVLNTIGQELGNLFSKNISKANRLRELWEFSYSQGQIMTQGLFTGREIRLIVIGAFSVLSKKYYEATKNFIFEIINMSHDWETCDQLALRVIVNLVIQNQKETFFILTK